MKIYPTFDNLGFVFNLSVSKASENVKKLQPILSHAQSKLKIQPLRKLTKVSDLESALEALNEHEDSIDSTVLEKETSFVAQILTKVTEETKESDRPIVS